MYNTFKAFRPHFDALAGVGYFKIVMKPVSQFKRSLHNFYRNIVWTVVITYNLQHLLRVIQVRHSIHEMVNTLFILLTTLNCLGKHVAFNIRVSRIDRIISIIDGSLFAPNNKEHVTVLENNERSMLRLLKLYHCAIFLCISMWTVYPLVNRALGQDVQFTGYIPFDTTESFTFVLTVAYMSIAISIQAYGNVTMDCTIVAFYTQAKSQLRIIRRDLEHLVDSDVEHGTTADNIRKNSEYKDEANQNFTKLLHNRLVHCVHRHQEIVWFVKEIESIFEEAMVVQILAMAWVICMTVYKIVGLNIISAEAFSMVMYLFCMLAQLFIYCFYGTQLKVESELVNESIYSAEWTSVSPALRHQLLLMMTCCPSITPRAAYVIPMSTETYISILRFSYTLFTVLDRK